MTKRARAAAPTKDETTGLYGFVIDAGSHDDGRRRQIRRRGFRTKAEAQAELHRLVARLEAGTHVDPNSVTVGEYLTSWAEGVASTVAASTAHSYSRQVAVHVVPRIGHVRLQKLTAGQLNKLYADLLTPGANVKNPDRALSARSVRYVHVIVHRALGDAVRHGLVARNVADLADPPAERTDREKVKAWTAEQLAWFLAADTDDRDRTIWRLLAATGMRRGECLGLRWRDIDLETATLTITQQVTIVAGAVTIGPPKSRASARTISLDETTVAELRSHRARRAAELLLLGLGQAPADELVFCAPDGSPMNPDLVSGRFQRLAARCGLPRIGVHGLRHSWASLALLAGVHPRVVQERLGHSNIAITLGIYSHVLDGQDAEAAATVAALFTRPVVTGS
jgi:integrase